jgi:DNA-binding MarR family transcriptional regulator
MQEPRRQDRPSKAAGAEPEAAPGAPAAYVLEKQVGHLLRRAHQRASAIFAELIGEDHLTPLQYAVLVKVHDLGSVTQNRLGRRTAMDPATIKGVVARLRDRGLLARGPDPGNRRQIVWRLTRAGAAVVARTLPRGRRISQRTLEPLSPEEQWVFLSLLERLGEADGKP